MNLHDALAIAVNIHDQLAPWCERIDIAGSIRRQKPDVKDIEIVCIPKRREKDPPQPDLFSNQETAVTLSTQLIAVKKFVDIVSQWPKVKGEPETGKYTQRIIPGKNIRLDLFMCQQDNYGLILAIRTGSADYSRQLMILAKSKGYTVEGGWLFYRGERVPVRDEPTLFRLLGCKYPEPSTRK